MPLQKFLPGQVAWAVVHALCLFLALAPFNLWPLAFVATFALFMAARRQQGESFARIAATGALFAGAVTFITFGWIVATIHRYTGQSVAVTALLSLAYALLCQLKLVVFFILYRVVFRTVQFTWINALAVSAVLSLCDALLPELFPWSWGNALAAQSFLRQWASVGSVYLLGFFAAFGGATLAAIFAPAAKLPWPRRISAIKIHLAGLCAAATVGVVLFYQPVSGERTLSVVAVQTNIGAAPEAKRSDADFAADAINRLFNQSLEGLILHGGANLILWAEASMPFHASDGGAENRDIYSPTFDAVPDYLHRISGAAILYQDLHRRKNRLFARLAVRPAAATESPEYLKRRLVPWGEYLPFEAVSPRMRTWFPEAGRLNAGADGNEISVRFAAMRAFRADQERLRQDVALMSAPEKIRAAYPLPNGTGQVTIKPLLCYEALFPRDSRVADAALIVNLASDAWFGDGVEGEQHAGAVALRAVENGVPMLRAAMSGVSFMVDARGEDLVQRSGQGRPAILHADIPLASRKTVFRRFGMAAFYALMAALLWPYLLERWFFKRQ